MTQSFFIPELPPMLNGKGGLLRMHWGQRKKLNEKWVWLIRAQRLHKHSGRVIVEFTRVSARRADLDNIAASFKPIGDALVKCGIVQDDNSGVITELRVKWEKGKPQGVRITDRKSVV